MRERVALMLMYLVGKTYQDGGPAWTFSSLTQQLDVPSYALQMVLEALEQKRLLVRTGDDPPAYLPGRDLGFISLEQLLHTVRAAGEERYLGPEAVPVPAAIEALLARVNLAIDAQVRDLTLRDLLTPAPQDPAGG
jgi:membrane protein